MICAWPMGNRIFPVKLDNSMIVKSVWIGMFFDTVGLFTAENKDYFSRNARLYIYILSNNNNDFIHHKIYYLNEI